MDKKTIEVLKQNLPRHPDIMGREKFFNAAVLIPLVDEKGEFHFLLEKRAKNIRQGGEISFPGGRFEPNKDNSCINAAIRETEEEIGVSREKIEIIGRLDTFVSPRGIIIESFIGVLDIDVHKDIDVDKNEVEEVLLLPVSWFEKNPPEKYLIKVEIKPYYTNNKGEKVPTLPIEELGLPPLYKNPWPSMDYEIFVFKNPSALIWGITARLIVEFILKINKNYLDYTYPSTTG